MYEDNHNVKKLGFTIYLCIQIHTNLTIYIYIYIYGYVLMTLVLFGVISQLQHGSSLILSYLLRAESKRRGFENKRSFFGSLVPLE